MENINDPRPQDIKPQEMKNELEDEVDTIQLDVQNIQGLIEFEEQEVMEIKMHLSNLNKKLS